MSDGIIISWGLDEDEKPVAFHESQYSARTPSSTASTARQHEEASAPQKTEAPTAPAAPGNSADRQRIQTLEAEIHHMKTEISLRDNRIHVLTQKLNDIQEDNKKLERLLQQAETSVEGEKRKPWWKKT
jgi:chromosome segregation ATPase